MGNVGLPEILVIAVIGLLVFGPRKLPEMARNAGRALNEFRRVTGEFTEELKAGLDDPPTPPRVAGAGEPLTGTEMLPLDLPAGDANAVGNGQPVEQDSGDGRPGEELPA